MKILLAEDDGNLRATLAEGLKNEGYEVVDVANGTQALEALSGTPFAAAVLDGLLPKMTGFDVAKQLRAKSPNTGVVLMSGVFKGAQQQQDHLQATGAKAYLVKPFDLRRLIDTLRPFAPPPAPGAGSGGGGGGAAATPQQPLPAEGNLLEMPALYLAWRIHKEQHTGVLELFAPAEKARIFAYRGRAVFAQHSDPLLHIGVELLKDGSLTPEQYKQVCDLAVQRGIGLYEVLKGENLATDAQMKAVYKGLVPRIVERCGWLVGKFRWHATDAFSSIVPAASSSLLDAILGGIAKATEKDLEPHVGPRRPLRLAPGENWREVAAMLPQACGSDSLTRAINGRATVAQMLEVSPTPQERATRFRQVFVLMSTMAVIASESAIQMAAPPPQPEPPQPPPQKQAPAAAAGFPRSATSSAQGVGGKVKPVIDASLDQGLQFNQQEQEARARIDAKYKEIEGKNYWEIVNVKKPDKGQQLDQNVLKKAFYALSRDFHPDSFAGMQLGAAQKKLEHVFSVIQEAYATLSDDNKRGEYEAKVNLEQGGGSSDIGALFAADSDFQKAKALYDRGDFAGSAKIIDRVVTIMATNEEVKAFKIFFDWWQSKNAAKAVEVTRALNDLHKLAPAMLSILDLQGWIYLEIGNLKYARGTFKKVLETDAKHVGANRGLTQVNRKMEEEAKAAKGGLGGLLKR